MHESYHRTLGEAVKKHGVLDKKAADKGEIGHAVITKHPVTGKVYLCFDSKKGVVPSLPKELESFIA
jgi:hypothetical protein